jgi:chemotaxis protein MotB
VSAKSTRPKRKRGHEEHEEHANHERWLVSYADMLTLLFVLFVVLFSMSSVDQKKFAQLAQGLAQGFGAPNVAFSGEDGALTSGKAQTTTVLPLNPGADPGLADAANTSDAKALAAARAAVAAAGRAKASADAQAAVREVENLRKIEEQIAAALRKAKMDRNVRFEINERGLVVTVVSSDVVFAGDRADLRPGGRRIIDAVAPSLAALPNNIAVDGHTNQLKVPTINYPSAWELSTARASVVVRELTTHGVKAKRLTASGYAGTRPLIDPADPRSVTMNRRVDVVVLSMLTPEQRALLPGVAKATEKTGATGTGTSGTGTSGTGTSGTGTSGTEKATTPHSTSTKSSSTSTSHH